MVRAMHRDQKPGRNIEANEITSSAVASAAHPHPGPLDIFVRSPSSFQCRLFMRISRPKMDFN
jgi:hypothetical protein